MKLKYNNLYSNILTEYEKLSTCDRLHVAALLVKDGRILSVGYNGTPARFMHCNQLFKHTDTEYQINYDLGIDSLLNKRSDELGWVTVDEQTYRTEHHKYAENTEIHAEMNCLAFALRNCINIQESELVLSVAPCMNCAKLIASSGIKTVHYRKEYDRSMEGIEFLEKCGVSVQKMNNAGNEI